MWDGLSVCQVLLTSFNAVIDIFDPLLKSPITSGHFVKEMVIVRAVARIVLGGCGHLLSKIELLTEDSSFVLRALAISKNDLDCGDAGVVLSPVKLDGGRRHLRNSHSTD